MSEHAYHALLLGNSTFPSDPHNLPALEGPRNDPALLRDALCDDRYGLFPSDNVRLVVERTMAEILEETETFFRGARRDDALLLYYSGHGRLDLSNELYLCARNSRVDLLRATAVKASDLRAMIDDSAAATTVVIVDCCHSGAFKGGSLAEKLTGRGTYVLTSCRTGELAQDSSASNRASLFTHHLVQGMLGGAADYDSDGLIVLEDLYRYTHHHLAAEHRQIPERSYAGSGDIPMAVCPPSGRETELVEVQAGPQEEVGGAGADVDADVVTSPVEDRYLDISPMELVLDSVEVGENLPPERVVVIDRGDEKSTWSAVCRSEWVTFERDDHGLLLHLRPSLPGTNRANLEIRDDDTGRIDTVRVIVRAIESSTTNLIADLSDRDRPAQGPDWWQASDGKWYPRVPRGPHQVDADTRTDVVTKTKEQTAAILTMMLRNLPSAWNSGWLWQARHSIWLLSTLPMGFTTWAGFLYVGVRAKRRDWMLIAATYGVGFTAVFVFMSSAPTDVDGVMETGAWQTNVSIALLLILWIGGVVHGLIINRKWLIWCADVGGPGHRQDHSVPD